MSKNLGKEKKTLKQKTLDSIGWGLCEKGFGIFIHLIIGIILARLLPPSDFGLIGLGMIVIEFGKIVVNLGLGPSIIQREVINSRHIRVVFTTSFFIGLILMGLVILTSSFIASLLKNSELRSVLNFLSIIFLISALQIPGHALLKKRMDFRYLFYISIFHSICYGFCTILLSILEFGVWSLVYGNILATSVNLLITYYFTRHSLFPLLARSELTDLANFGIGMTLSEICNYFARQGDYLIIGRTLGTYSLGLYSKSYSIMQLPTQRLISVISGVLFPAISKIQTDTDRVIKAFLKSMRIIAFITIPLCTLIVIIAPDLVIGLYGENWQGAVIPLQLIGFFGVFRAMYNTAGSFLQALGWIYQLFWAQFIYGSFMIFSVWFSAKYYGLNGAALAAGLSILLMWLMLIGLCSKAIKINFSVILNTLIPGIRLSLILAMPILLLQQLILGGQFLHIVNLFLLIFATLLLIVACIYLPQKWFSFLPYEIFSSAKQYVPLMFNKSYTRLLSNLSK